MATLRKDQSMNGAWIEAFELGTRTDSAGVTSDWTPERVDGYLAKYQPAFHEAPLRIDHIEPGSRKGKGPAFGWVEAAKREGNKVLVKLRDVAPQFEEWVKQGLVKKRSIAFDETRGIHHLAFLGYTCPAVPGMENVYDDGDKCKTFEFAWTDQVELGFWRKLKNWIIGKDGQQVADDMFPEYEMEVLQRDIYLSEQSDQPISSLYSDEEERMKPEEVQALIDKAMGGAAQQLQQFGETVTGLRDEIAALKQGQDADRDIGLRREFHEFLLTPEMKQRVNEGSRTATINHMMTLVAAEPVQFGEGDAKTTKPALDVYKEQLMALPPVVVFGEHATKGRAGNVSINGMTAEAIAAKAVEFQEAEARSGRTISITEAVNHVRQGGK